MPIQGGSSSSNKVAAEVEFYLFRLAVGTSHSVKCQSNRIPHHKPASVGIQGQREGILLCKAPTVYSTISKEIPYRKKPVVFICVSVTTHKTGFVSCTKWPHVREEPSLALDTQTQTHFLPTHTSFPLEKGAAQKPDGELRPHQFNFSSGCLGWLLRISEQGALRGSC